MLDSTETKTTTPKAKARAKPKAKVKAAGKEAAKKWSRPSVFERAPVVWRRHAEADLEEKRKEAKGRKMACACCGKVVRRGGLARHHKSDACRQAQRKLWPCSCCGPASGVEADIFAREVFGCNNGAVIIDGVDYAPKLSRAAHFNGYTPIPLPDRDHSGPAALLKADSTSEEDGSGLAADGKDNVYIVEEGPCVFCEYIYKHLQAKQQAKKERRRQASKGKGKGRKGRARRGRGRR